MTVTLDLSPEQERLLRQEAEARGVDANELLQRMLQEAFAWMEADSPAAPRIPGLHAGHTRIRDDFDAPLPDSFWTGAEWISFDR